MKSAYRFFQILFLLASCMQTTSCSDSEQLNFPLPLEPATESGSEIDLWLTDNFLHPFNIEVLYKWSPYEVNYNRVLVPPREDKVLLALDVVKQTWIDPYIIVAGADFFKEYTPKKIVLVGSAEYNDDGTYVLGQAEAGSKIILFVINQFDASDETGVKMMLHTIHHEFAHILHQTKLYPREYKEFTPDGYTASWYNTSVEDALSLGFISPYARSSADEDFVEMVATLLVVGEDGFEAKVQQAPPESREILYAKRAIVLSYFNEAWGIDFNQLQAVTQENIESILCGC